MPRIRACACASLLAAATFYGCTAAGEGPAPAPRAAAQAAPVPVTVTTVVKKSMPVEIRVVGTAAAYSTVDVHPQVAGQLTSVSFNEGDEVRQDQTLFTLDRRPFEAALEQAEANLARDLAQAENAKSQLRRYRELAQRGLTTPEQVEQINTTATALEATIRADRASIQNAKLQLDYTTIRSPVSGRTGALMMHPGNNVQPTQAVPLVVINQVAPIYVSFAIPESQLADVKRYMASGTLRVDAELPNEAGHRASGRITFLDNSVDQATGTIKMKGTFPNQDRLFWPGQFVNVVLTLATIPNAVVVLSEAVQAGQQGTYVFRVKPDQTVEVKPVTVALTSETESVITDGIEPGDVVVQTGQLRLVARSRISVKTGETGVRP